MEAFFGAWIRSCFCSECGRFRVFSGFEIALPGQEAACHWPVWIREAGWGAATRHCASPLACPPVFLALPSCAAATARKRPVFRSFFDSGKARQTVRWRRFLGPGFAPVFAVNAGVSGCFQALKSPCRVRKRLAIGLCGFGKRAGARPPAIAPARLPVRPSFWRFRHAQPPRPARGRFFAPSLIAEKPVKPCDGGVFWGLNSLSKKE